MECTGLHDNSILSSSDFWNQNQSAWPSNNELVRPVALQESVEKQVFTSTEIELKNICDMLISSSWEMNYLDTETRVKEIKNKLELEEEQIECLDKDGPEDVPEDGLEDGPEDGPEEDVPVPDDDSPHEVDRLVSSASDFINKAKKIMGWKDKDVVFGYIGNRDSDYNSHEPLKRIANCTVQFLENSGITELKLDGFPFIVEGTRDQIDDFFDKYEKQDFHFTAKSIDESNESVVYVNIRGCLEDVKLAEIVQKQVLRLIMPAISAIPGEIFCQFFKIDEFVAIFYDTIERLAIGEIPDFETLIESIDTSFDMLKHDMAEAAEGIVEGGVAGFMEEGMEGIFETFQGLDIHSTLVQAPEESKTDRAEVESMGKRFVKKLKDIICGRNIPADLSSNGFNYVSGPIDLLSELRSEQRLQVEFDRLESSKSTACLQISSVGSRVNFANIRKALTALY